MKKFYTALVLLFGLINYAQQGELDQTFGTNGIINFTNFINPNKMTFQPDGKILLLGNQLNLFEKIIRFNLDGTLDQTFGTSGIATVTNGPGKSIDLQSDGKIVISAGGSAYRFNSNGSPDLTFNNSGSIDNARYLKVLNDDSMIATYSNGFPIYTKKINANGTENTTFNGGVNPNYNGGSGHSCIGINRLDNGKIVIATDVTFFHRRYNANGSFDLDYTFPGNTSIQTDVKSLNNSLFITLQYGFNSEFSIFKYDASANLDTTFSADGIAQTSFNDNVKNFGYNLNIQSSGKIILVGKTGNFTSGSIGIARFNTDGSLDLTFGTAGKTVTQTNSLPEIKTLSAISPIDNKLYVISRNNTIGNAASQDILIARYTTGSNLSATSFNKKNIFSISPNPTNSILNIKSWETLKSTKIIDLLGRKTNITNFDNNTIDVSNLQTGVYFLEIATENGNQTQKFFKN